MKLQTTELWHDPKADRRSRRFEIRIPVSVRIYNGQQEQVFEAELVNVSEGGVFVKGIFPVALGCRVTLETEGMHLESQVRWVRGSSQSGFGAEFDGSDPKKKAFIARLVERAIFGRSPALVGA